MAIPSLQLPKLTPLEPLTAGTNLPQVPVGELESPPRSGLEPNSEEDKPTTPNPPTSTNIDGPSVSPPQSPDRPTSMRRFLSRVSLNSSYTNGDDKSSIFSAPTSMSSPEANKKPKKSSWWKKSSKRHSIAFPSTASIQESLSNGVSTQPNAATVQSIPPPPRLPDNMFGNNLSSLDNDMFKNFK